MLVVRRRAGEILLIGESVEIEILEVSGGQVKLGIRAPREIAILRKEIQLTAEQNRRSSQGISRSQLENLHAQCKIPSNNSSLADKPLVVIWRS